MSTLTLSIEEAAAVAGIARSTGYREAAEEGTVLGVPLLRSRGRLLVPVAPLAQVLGVTPADLLDAAATHRDSVARSA